ncbi:MAG: histidine kinase [Hylemonella sp.]|uniref:MHYT domain-containing protein n=1 Tax=Hylemonella sp. TaxID=2066020 RepID=UPI0022C8CC5E|nr:MHYT domain-containing protein [Hylemonella sp.]MCZ8253871.1 histidine kinase [Hylemonella sp.]
MNPEVISSYDTLYVSLSFALAFIGSFVALTAARRMIGPNGKINSFDLLAATLALGGIGVWTMHFIGMAALKMDLRVGYSMVETVISLVVVCAATAFGLVHVARDPSNRQRLLVAGGAVGLGVVVMHYLGMYGMRFGGYIDWASALVALSILIAIVAATAALWLAFNTKQVALRLVAAAVMAVAVCAMHYTGMAAADFVCTTADRLAPPRGFGVIISTDLPDVVTVMAIGIALVLSIDLLVQKAVRAQKLPR